MNTIIEWVGRFLIAFAAVRIVHKRQEKRDRIEREKQKAIEEERQRQVEKYDIYRED